VELPGGPGTRPANGARAVVRNIGDRHRGVAGKLGRVAYRACRPGAEACDSVMAPHRPAAIRVNEQVISGRNLCRLAATWSLTIETRHLFATRSPDAMGRHYVTDEWKTRFKPRHSAVGAAAYRRRRRQRASRIRRHSQPLPSSGGPASAASPAH
jgi:hypothetical protein